MQLFMNSLLMGTLMYIHVAVSIYMQGTLTFMYVSEHVLYTSVLSMTTISFLYTCSALGGLVFTLQSVAVDIEVNVYTHE